MMARKKKRKTAATKKRTRRTRRTAPAVEVSPDEMMGAMMGGLMTPLRGRRSRRR
jgi:predicted lipid-binding transport protein (Tim44 family)